jgi:hypothetical protein
MSAGALSGRCAIPGATRVRGCSGRRADSRRPSAVGRGAGGAPPEHRAGNRKQAARPRADGQRSLRECLPRGTRCVSERRQVVLRPDPHGHFACSFPPLQRAGDGSLGSYVHAPARIPSRNMRPGTVWRRRDWSEDRAGVRRAWGWPPFRGQRPRPAARSPCAAKGHEAAGSTSVPARTPQSQT